MDGKKNHSDRLQDQPNHPSQELTMSDALQAVSYRYLSSTHQAILNLSNRTTEEQLEFDLENIVNSIGFDMYHYSGNFRLKNNQSVQRVASNLPKSWLDKHIHNDSPDPIRVLAQHRLTPIIFENLTTAATVSDDNCFALSIIGVGAAVIFPAHAKSGDTAVLGFFTRNDRPDVEGVIDGSLGELSLLTTYFHDAITKNVAHSSSLPKAPLTPREIECLQLIANYKSNWVISRIFGTSEHAVVYYVRRLMWKLDAQNRHQAVERAAACGLI
jgi:DNA-binding CsgD family transcriptional regulator